MDDPADRLLQALPPLLEARLRRLGQLWEVDPAALVERVLERGLYECEAELRARFTPTEADAWRAALVALQKQPDDAGFASIGRIATIDDAMRPTGTDARPQASRLPAEASVGRQREARRNDTPGDADA